MVEYTPTGRPSSSPGGGGGGVADRDPGHPAIAAVNGAITQVARTLTKELAPLRVNVVSPEFVDTPAYDGMEASGREAMFADGGPGCRSGGLAVPADIPAGVIMVLENSFATGVLLGLDGGAR